MTSLSGHVQIPIIGEQLEILCGTQHLLLSESEFRTYCADICTRMKNELETRRGLQEGQWSSVSMGKLSYRTLYEHYLRPHTRSNKR